MISCDRLVGPPYLLVPRFVYFCYMVATPPIVSQLNPGHTITKYLRSVVMLSFSQSLDFPRCLFPSFFPDTKLHLCNLNLCALHCPPILFSLYEYLNPLTPNDTYRGRTAPLTSKRFILYIYSTNIGTEYFKHGIYSPFLSLQNAVRFIILTYLVPVLFTFYMQSVLKLKK